MDQPEQTGELPMRGRSAQGLRSAVDTADFLIVHDGDADAPPPGPANGRIRVLRERVDTGDYAVSVERVAEAMVERVRRLQAPRSGED